MSFESFIELGRKRLALTTAKYQSCTNPASKRTLLRQIEYLKEILRFARPETTADTEERGRILKTYANTIRNTVTDEHPLWFHGVKDLASLEKILASGHLGYREDEESRSQTSPGTLDVTSRYSIDTTIEGFTGLSSNYLPAGCIFVLLPKDADEIQMTKKSGSEQHIETVDFNENPDRVYSIISTTENLPYISNLVKKYGLNEKKVHSFDSFIEKYRTDFRESKSINVINQCISQKKER